MLWLQARLMRQRLKDETQAWQIHLEPLMLQLCGMRMSSCVCSIPLYFLHFLRTRKTTQTHTVTAALFTTDNSFMVFETLCGEGDNFYSCIKCWERGPGHQLDLTDCTLLVQSSHGLYICVCDGFKRFVLWVLSALNVVRKVNTVFTQVNGHSGCEMYSK